MRIPRINANHTVGCWSFALVMPDTVPSMLSVRTMIVNNPNLSTSVPEAENTWPLSFITLTIVLAPISPGVRLSSNTNIHRMAAVWKDVNQEIISKASARR